MSIFSRIKAFFSKPGTVSEIVNGLEETLHHLKDLAITHAAMARAHNVKSMLEESLQHAAETEVTRINFLITHFELMLGLAKAPAVLSPGPSEV